MGFVCVFIFFYATSIGIVYAIWDLLGSYLVLKLMFGWLLGIMFVDLCKVWKKMIEYAIFFFLIVYKRTILDF